MSYRFKHAHGNHIPKCLKKSIKRLEKIVEKLRIGRTYNHKHNSSPGKIQFQREMPNTGWFKMKAFSHDGTIDLFVFGNKSLILGMSYQHVIYTRNEAMAAQLIKKFYY